MKRTICAFASVMLTLALSACTQLPSPTAPVIEDFSTPLHQTIPSTSPTVLPDQKDVSIAVYDFPMSALALPVTIQPHENDAGEAIAYYSYQNISLTLPDADVAQSIEQILKNRIKKTESDAQNVFSAADKNYMSGTIWYPYSYVISYQPMRLDENILSLFGTETAFDGSPRAIHKALSVSFDLTTGEELSLQTILHEENFADALCDLILVGLKDQEYNLFPNYENLIRNSFSTNVIANNWFFNQNGLCFYFAPYEIAPFSAGTIISEIPYASLSGLLKDSYFPGEKALYTGSVDIQEISSADILKRYTQFSEVTLHEGGTNYLITTNGSITNVQLNLTFGAPETGITNSTVLFLAGLGPTDAIMLEIDSLKAINNLSISYLSDGSQQTRTLKQTNSGAITFSE